MADNLPPSSADVTVSGSLNLPERSGPHRPVMGVPFFKKIIIRSFHSLLYNLCGRCAVIKKITQTNHVHRQSWSKSELHLQNVLNDVLLNFGTRLFDWSFLCLCEHNGNSMKGWGLHMKIWCVQKVTAHLWKVSEAMSTSVNTGLNPLDFICKHFLQICLWEISNLCSYRSF
jgi:hypothetical protein